MGDVLMKSAIGLTGSGVRDWVLQRASAVVLAVYTVVLLGWFLLTPQVTYETWYGFMMTLPMKLFSVLAVVSLAGHAWVGMWTIFTDYITTSKLGPVGSSLRFVLQIAMALATIVYTVWGIAIFFGS